MQVSELTLPLVEQSSSSVLNRSYEITDRSLKTWKLSNMLNLDRAWCDSWNRAALNWIYIADLFSWISWTIGIVSVRERGTAVSELQSGRELQCAICLHWTKFSKCGRYHLIWHPLLVELISKFRYSSVGWRLELDRKMERRAEEALRCQAMAKFQQCQTTPCAIFNIEIESEGR